MSYNDGEARDDHGRWAAEGTAGGSDAAGVMFKNANITPHQGLKKGDLVAFHSHIDGQRYVGRVDTLDKETGVVRVHVNSKDQPVNYPSHHKVHFTKVTRVAE